MGKQLFHMIFLSRYGKKNLGAVGFWSRLCDTGLKQISQTMYSRYKRTDEAQLMRAAQLSKQQLEPIP